MYFSSREQRSAFDITMFSFCIVTIIPTFALIFILQQSRFNLNAKPAVFSFISWLSEPHLLVFSTRRAHQIFKMFISCLYTWMKFWVSKIVLGLIFVEEIINIGLLFPAMGIRSGGIGGQPYFFSVVNELIFLHGSPKDSLSLKFSSFVTVCLCVTLSWVTVCPSNFANQIFFHF